MTEASLLLDRPFLIGRFFAMAEFLEINPMKQLPALHIDGHTLSESVAILEVGAAVVSSQEGLSLHKFMTKIRVRLCEPSSESWIQETLGFAYLKTMLVLWFWHSSYLTRNRGFLRSGRSPVFVSLSPPSQTASEHHPPFTCSPELTSHSDCAEECCVLR